MKNKSIEELKVEKSKVYHKIRNLEKAGKEVPAELRKKLEELDKEITKRAAAPKIVTIPEHVAKAQDTGYHRPKLDGFCKRTITECNAFPKLTYKQAEKALSGWLDENNYEDGYIFRHSINFYMVKPKISQDRKTGMLRFNFRLQFLTKSRKVTKDIEWEVPYGEWSRISNRLESLEKVILKETSDPDRSDQVFGYDRFQRNLFFEKGYDKNGWKIRK